MKWLLGLLLLLNAALLGYFRLQPAPAQEPSAGHETLAPEKLRILTPEEVQQMPAEPATQADPAESPADGTQDAAPTGAAAGGTLTSSATSVGVMPASSPEPVGTAQALQVSNASACYEWGSFTGAEIARVRAVLDQLRVEAVAVPVADPAATHYWVFVPPRRNQGEAQAKVAELRGLGVTDSYIVQEASWRHAISLGVFKEEAMARRFLDELKGRGVRSAVVGPRSDKAQMRYTFRSPASAQAAGLDKARSEFPGSELRQVACP